MAKSFIDNDLGDRYLSSLGLSNKNKIFVILKKEESIKEMELEVIKVQSKILYGKDNSKLRKLLSFKRKELKALKKDFVDLLEGLGKMIPGYSLEFDTKVIEIIKKPVVIGENVTCRAKKSDFKRKKN